MEVKTNSQFKATKRMLLDSAFSKTSFPLSYDSWNSLPDDLKSAALYVNFYRTITMAWSSFNKDKYHKAPITTDDAVGLVLDMLEKNVPIIVGDAKRYTDAYIYCIAWRSICAVTRTKCVNEYYNTVKSNLEYDALTNDVIDLFDLVPCEDDPYELVQARDALWAIIEGMGPKALKVADHLINDSSLRRSHKLSNDLLADVSVNADEYSVIVKELKAKMKPLGYIWGY